MPKKKRKGKGRRAIDLRASADDDPVLGEEQLRRYYKPLKKSVTLRMDADVVAWFKEQGPKYQSRINRALRELMIEERKAGRERS
jgi:uncharacterized protein (DUF4415 family)